MGGNGEEKDGEAASQGESMCIFKPLTPREMFDERWEISPMPCSRALKNTQPRYSYPFAVQGGRQRPVLLQF